MDVLNLEELYSTSLFVFIPEEEFPSSDPSGAVSGALLHYVDVFHFLRNVSAQHLDEVRVVAVDGTRELTQDHICPFEVVAIEMCVEPPFVSFEIDVGLSSYLRSTQSMKESRCE